MNKALAKIEAQIKKLEQKRDHLKVAGRAERLKIIVQTMRENSISPEEIHAAYRPAGPAKARAADAAVRKQRPPVQPKYRHPQTGETWSGRGKPPRWLAAEERGGARRDQFAIASREHVAQAA